jgi:hypothetical protein
MPTPDPSFGWPEASIAFASIALVAFLVTWVVTDLLHVRRTPYVAILSLVVVALSVGYLAWSGTSLRALVVEDSWWGLLAGALAGGILSPLVRRLPGRDRPTGGRLFVGIGYEGFLYGTAEGLLLATLPVLAAWHVLADAGMTTDTLGRVGSGAIAVVAAVFVVLVHHLGYAEFRTPEARRELAGALFACGLQAVAFVVTGNVLAPILAHIVLHIELLVRGIEMPPSEERVARPTLAQMAGSEALAALAPRTGRDRARS